MGAVAALTARPAAQQRIEERVTVSRVLVDARVMDGRGQPVLNLSADDFMVEFDGRPARVEWSQWIGADGAEPSSGVPETLAPARIPGQPSGRLIVFLFQKDLMPSRGEGMIRVMRDASQYAERLGPGDRAAVVVYEHSLRVWQDFTSDRNRLRRVLGGGIFSQPPSLERAPDVSLLAALEKGAGPKPYSPELALLALGDALGRIEGAKSLVLFGYGFGELKVPFGEPTDSYAVQNADYDRARQALIASRTTVFALDITQADHHSLETGLMAVADETGGFYASTFELPQVAMNRLDAALRGYYVLSVEKGAQGAAGTRHEIRVRVRPKGATVLARQYYVE
jgi:VWFA-related protein